MVEGNDLGNTVKEKTTISYGSSLSVYIKLETSFSRNDKQTKKNVLLIIYDINQDI